MEDAHALAGQMFNLLADLGVYPHAVRYPAGGGWELRIRLRRAGSLLPSRILLRLTAAAEQIELVERSPFRKRRIAAWDLPQNQITEDQRERVIKAVLSLCRG